MKTFAGTSLALLCGCADHQVRARRRPAPRLLVARDGDRLRGLRSSQPCRAHPAFARTIETSVCVAPDAAGAGIGSAPYQRLFAALAGENLHRPVAGIAPPDEASVRLHARLGFRPMARRCARRCG